MDAEQAAQWSSGGGGDVLLAHESGGRAGRGDAIGAFFFKQESWPKHHLPPPPFLWPAAPAAMRVEMCGGG